MKIRLPHAAGAMADAVEDQRRAVQVTLLSEVARNYISLRALQRRLAVAQSNLTDQQKTLDWRDLQDYLGQRAQRGAVLKRGWPRKITRMEAILPAATA